MTLFDPIFDPVTPKQDGRRTSARTRPHSMSRHDGSWASGPARHGRFEAIWDLF